uniref:CUB domain-containing protein n=1 Tax=Parastrongyloides trichosuri TaxID=131310 RepID=A0A0N4ZKU7_PARTI
MLLFLLLSSLDISAKISKNVGRMDKSIEVIDTSANEESISHLQNDISLISIDPKPTKPIYMPLEAISMDIIHNMDQDSECKEFMPGGMSGINELASPRYPSLYPSNMDCVRIIYAPSGYDIVINFKNIFQIESSYMEILKEGTADTFINSNDSDNNMIMDCPNDYLTIRDGRFSFSPLVARLCGHKLPSFNITLHSAFAWLHFHSDSLLQYTGFQASYEFIKSKISTHIQIPCYFSNIIRYDGLVNSSSITQFYFNHRNGTGPLECVWQFSVPLQDMEKLKIAVFVEEFHLADPNDCTSNFVELYQGHVSELPMQRFCGTQVTHTYSDSNSVYLKFYAQGKSQVQKLRLKVLYSTYAPYPNCSENNMFSCGGDICIPNDLKCNGRNNCLYQQDETNCSDTDELWDRFFQSSLASLIMAIICVFFIVLTLCVWYNPFKQYYRRSKKQRSYNFDSNINEDIFSANNCKEKNIKYVSTQKKSIHSSQNNLTAMFGPGPRLFSSPSSSIFNATTSDRRLIKARTIDMESINDFINNAQRQNSIASVVSIGKKSLELPERQCKISFHDAPINLNNIKSPEYNKNIPIKSIMNLPLNSPNKSNLKKITEDNKISNISSELVESTYDNFNPTSSCIDEIINLKNHHQNCKKNNEITGNVFNSKRKTNFPGNIYEVDVTTLPGGNYRKVNKNSRRKNSCEKNNSETTYNIRDSSCEPLITRNTEKTV